MAKLGIVGSSFLDDNLKTLIRHGVLAPSLRVQRTDFVLGFIVSKFAKEMANAVEEIDAKQEEGDGDNYED